MLEYTGPVLAPSRMTKEQKELQWLREQVKAYACVHPIARWCVLDGYGAKPVTTVIDGKIWVTKGSRITKLK